MCPPPTPSFASLASRMVMRDRTKQTDFFFRTRSCECVGLHREKSLFLFAFIALPRLNRPILHFQPPHSPELPLVVRDQRQPRRLRMRCNPQIVVPDHLPLASRMVLRGAPPSQALALLRLVLLPPRQRQVRGQRHQ